jgi:hypothetical protein
MSPYAVTRDGFLRLPITPEDYEWANAAANDMGALRNSIREGEGNLTGFLGEALVRRAFSSGQTNTYDFDLTFSDDDGAATFDVKTKDRTAVPRLNYQASVANFNTRQKADFYCFVSLFRPDDDDRTAFTYGFVCGIIPKAEYMERAVFRKKGEVDPTDPRGWKIKADCWNLDYGSLYRFEGW